MKPRNIKNNRDHFPGQWRKFGPLPDVSESDFCGDDLLLEAQLVKTVFTLHSTFHDVALCRASIMVPVTINFLAVNVASLCLIQSTNIISRATGFVRGCSSNNSCYLIK